MEDLRLDTLDTEGAHLLVADGTDEDCAVVLMRRRAAATYLSRRQTRDLVRDLIKRAGLTEEDVYPDPKRPECDAPDADGPAVVNAADYPKAVIDTLQRQEAQVRALTDVAQALSYAVERLTRGGER